MELMMPREKWTDDRLDEFDKKVEDGYVGLEKKIDDGFAQVDRRFAAADKRVDDGFARVDRRFAEVDTEIRELRDETNQRFDKVEGKMDSGFAELRGEMNSLKKSLFTASVSVIVALIGCFGTLIAVAIAG